MKLHHFSFLALLFPLLLSAQNRTVGVFQNDSLAFDGYTLFGGSTSNDTYLIDNCGYEINRWKSSLRPGLAVYLLEDGSLLRTARISSDFNAGGTGGRLEKYNWEGDITWTYDYASETRHQHHDLAPLPNGNILILAWEKKTREEMLFAGRDSALVSNAGLWLEHVVEIEPRGTDEAEIVWEWYIGDHLVQDYDSGRGNFGEVAMHPELLDLNYSSVAATFDWLHANSIDYNPELDQIILSSRNCNEFWVIDHSTTTVEAAGHEGGNAGKGGDILYRWGNPQVYDRGTAEDQRLFGQHNVQWIPAGYPDEGKILIFNNGLNRPEGDFSSVEVLAPPLNQGAATYALNNGEAFGPLLADWTYEEPDFFSARISGTQRLPNGNTLICEGNEGRFFEVDSSGNTHWEYINPIRQTGPIFQGDMITGNDVFRATRYAPSYSAFANKNLTQGTLLELNPIEDSCQIFRLPTSTRELALLPNWQVTPNPVDDFLQIKINQRSNFDFEIVDLAGRIVHTRQPIVERPFVSTAAWFPGLYFVQLFSKTGEFIAAQKIIKQ